MEKRHNAVPSVKGGAIVYQRHKSPRVLMVRSDENPDGRMIGTLLSVEWAEFLMESANHRLVNLPTGKKERSVKDQ